VDRTERFYRIDRLLRSRHRTSLHGLLDELGVARAAVVRDIQYLRDQRSPAARRMHCRPIDRCRYTDRPLRMIAAASLS